jgi:glycine cleavage system aminomethyltransferase T
MTLHFLTPAAPDAPPARGPLADAAAAAGATVEERHGWSVPTSFGDFEAEAAACRETVGFADLSHLTKLELQGSPEALTGALGTLTHGSAVTVDGGWHCPVRPRLALVLGDPDQGPVKRDALAGDGVRVCDVTAVWGALAIAGPLARDLFARFCALDLRETALPVRGFRPGSVARSAGYVLREDEDRFLMLFGAAYGAYVWEVVADAAARLGGRPVGLDALVSKEAARA